VSATTKYPLYKYLLATIDWLIVSASLLMALNLREHGLSGNLLSIHPSFYAEVAFFIGYGALSVFIFQYFNLYKVNVFLTLVDHSLQVFKALLCTVIGIAVVSFFTKAPWVVDSRLAIAYFAGIAIVLSVSLRVICFRKLFQWFSRSELFRRNAIIVGAGESGKSLAINLLLHNYGGLNLVGFIDDGVPKGNVVFGGMKVLASLSELEDALQQYSVEEIIICLDGVDRVHLMNVVDRATTTNANVKISSPLYGVVPSRVFIEQYGDFPVVGITQTQPSSLNEKYKRIFDVVVTVIVLILLVPFFIVVGVLIKWDSRGSVFFSQTRMGKNGSAFNFYKFRSMVMGSDHDAGRELQATQFVRGAHNGNGSTKIVNESRVTHVGKWLRRTSLDELPQLFNVLKGEMSLVGPRPCLPYEWDHYEEWHKKRLSVLPGCTGMWQVSGRSAVGFDDMVVLDIYYIQNASLLLDLRLLLKTVPVILLGTGAK